MHSIVLPSQSEQGVCRDPNDDAILACALEARADYLVTGDVDLLELKIFKGIRIVTPRDFEILFKLPAPESGWDDFGNATVAARILREMI